MGNKIKELSIMTKTANSLIGVPTTCPNCEEEFPGTITYENSFRPSDQERLKLQRKRKKSKDSAGSKSSRDSQEADDDIDYTTVEVYIKKREKGFFSGSLQSSSNTHQEISGNVTPAGKADLKNERQFKWTKSFLTYSEHLLSEMPLKEISKQGSAYKFLWLYQKLSERRVTWKEGAEQLTFHPENIVKDSLVLLKLNLYKELKIVVTNDIVKDAGGLLREWSNMLLIEIVTKFDIFIRNKQGFYTLNPKYSITSNLDRLVWPELIEKTGKPSKKEEVLAGDLDEREDEYKKYIASLQCKYFCSGKKENKMEITVGNTTYRDLYKMFTSLLIKILIEKVTVPIYFDHIFISNLLGVDDIDKERNLYAIYTYDKEIYESLKCLKAMQTSTNEEIQELCLTFTVPKSEYLKETNLIKGGNHILIDSTSKLKEYIEKLESYYLNELHANQMKIIKETFHQTIKPDIWDGLLDCDEFELLVNGIDGDNISVKDWQAGTEYREPYSADHKVIRYFWNTVEKMNGEEKMRLLKFVTGSERLPVFGFKQLETNRGETSCFVIEPIKYDKKKNHFPKAHTCFNRLVLPIYSSEGLLSECLFSIVRGNFDGVWGME